MKLNVNERKVLAFLVEEGCTWDEGFAGFAFIIANTQLDRPTVRRACRSLKRKGLTEFGSGLWSEDGYPAGSGYTATKEGAAMIADQRGEK